MSVVFTPLPTDTVRALQRGGPDAYGNAPERAVSDGDGIPCRHCLEDVAAGEDYLILAYAPFTTRQAFAETGPIFLHAKECAAAHRGPERPQVLSSPDYIVRGYSSAERIVYGTGKVTPIEAVASYAGELFERDDIAFVHVRSARNNCFQVRIDRG